MNKRIRIMVDFDGTLNTYTTPFTTEDNIPDPPVKGAIKFLQELLDSEMDVMIFTTRGATLKGRVAVRNWLKNNGIKNPPRVTDKKYGAHLYIDDKGFQFRGQFPTLDYIRNFKAWNK